MAVKRTTVRENPKQTSMAATTARYITKAGRPPACNRNDFVFDDPQERLRPATQDHNKITPRSRPQPPSRLGPRPAATAHTTFHPLTARTRTKTIDERAVYKLADDVGTISKGQEVPGPLEVKINVRIIA